MLSFQHIEYLIGIGILLPILLFFLSTLWWKKRVKKQIGDPELVDALTKDHSPKNYNYKFILLSLAVALFVVAAANLRSPKQGVTGNKSGIDVMVALDVSNSMLAQDVKPNRLERAKQVLNRIIEKMGDNRMGMVVFAGQAFLQMPLTSDLGAAKLYVANASPEAVPTQGTVIGDALRLCNTSLDTKQKKYKSIILITDGEGHDEKTLEVVKELQDNGVIVHTIGIGSPDGAPIYDPGTKDYKKDESGNTVISKLNEKDLQAIATQTGGAYHLFTNADISTAEVMGALNQMEKKQTGGASEKTYTTYFQWFLLAAFILLILEIIIPERKMKWLSWGK